MLESNLTPFAAKKIREMVGIVAIQKTEIIHAAINKGMKESVDFLRNLSSAKKIAMININTTIPIDI